jgi:biopolymer transport protein ExbD
MARRKSKFTEEVEDLNLIPIMNLVLCLIPAVLFKTQLVKIGLIDVNAPQIAPPSNKPPKDDPDKPLGLTLMIDKKGFLLTAKGADLAVVLGETSKDGVRIGLTSDKDYNLKDFTKGTNPKGMTYNYVALYNRLKTLRDKFPDKKEKPPEILTISAENTVEFKYIIRVMDIARYEFAKDVKGPDDMLLGEAYNSYVEEKNEQGFDFKPLWAYVTFASPMSGQ